MADVVLSSLGNIVNIALQIKEAVETVHQNEDECRKIARCVEINSGLLKTLVNGTDVTKVEEMRLALEDVKICFEDALKLVKKCHKKHTFSRFFWAKDMAKELDLVKHDIGQKMQQASLCGTVYVATVVHYAAVTTAAPPPTVPPARVNEIRPAATAAPPGEKSIEGAVESFTEFDLSLLKAITNDFSYENMIGRGAFSNVYKGVLYDGRLLVAIKKFHRIYDQEPQRMYCDEFKAGTKLHHKNVVSLLVYCINIIMYFEKLDSIVIDGEDKEHFVVLGYVPNGSLEQVIQGKTRVDWSSCFKIIQEIAHGVHYIHKQRIIHLDLKPSNILFERDMTPVIIDFGLCKVLGPDDDEIVLDDVTGTVGYMAPEQYSASPVSTKSDVFVFGVTILRTTIAVCTTLSPLYDRGSLERMLAEAGGLNKVVHPKLQIDESQITEIRRCFEVGILCTEPEPVHRPSMADVINRLSGEKIPKKQERVATKNVEKALTKKLGRAVSRT